MFIGQNVEIRCWQMLSLGNNVSIHRGCYLDASGGIEVGDDVSIAHQTSILSANHTWDDPMIPIKENPVKLESVIIQNDVWIGCGCRIMSGVTVFSRSVVAAGSVVTKDVPSHTLVGGVPAKQIKVII